VRVWVSSGRGAFKFTACSALTLAQVACEQPKTLSTTRCWLCDRARIAKMSLVALPSDCLLACLARVPYADLRNVVPSTCKSLRDAVASKAFRKTRESAGWTEWAVFSAALQADSQCCFLVQASASHRTSRPPELECWFTQSLGDEVFALGEDPVFCTARFDPRQNRWRETAPSTYGHSISDPLTCLALGNTITVLSGEDGGMMDRHEVYDASQDAWSRTPAFPSELASVFDAKAVEVNGKLWLYAVDYEHVQETFIYDPETRTWTAGPHLPRYLYSYGGVHWHLQAFELRKRFCLMACFQLGPEDVRYLAFIWDPIREAWDEAPFPVPPVVCLHGASIDNNLIVSGRIESSDPTGPMKTVRLFVLRPGSGDWDEWRVPDELDSGMRIAAVRLG
jgi:hypothetical protein